MRISNNNGIEYAIVDIETTGGYAAGCGILEIAIIIHNGHAVTGRYETLINPERTIPSFITSLTGIDNDMVAESPEFEDVAEEVYSLLKGRVFVAHNVNFDYSFIKYGLEQAGYSYAAPRLCTVRLSRKLKPGLHSYSLGNLCEALAIPLSNRHRAGGDAEATAVLFTRLLEWDTKGYIAGMLKKGSKEEQLPPNVAKADFDALPADAGVYYFKDKAGKIIYVGKAIHLKKRVAAHFSGNCVTPRRQHFLNNIFHISYQVCATELMALLLECVEIKLYWPEYNHSLKRFEPKFGVIVYEDLNGYLRLAVGKLNKNTRCEYVFNRELEAVQFLGSLVRDFNLDPRLCAFQSRKEMKEVLCEEALSEQEPCAIYNRRVREALSRYNAKLPTFAVLDKGRSEEEISIIWVEKGRFYGMGYINRAINIQQSEAWKESLVRYPENDYMVQLIYSYAGKYPEKIFYPDKSRDKVWDD